jgi:hypothetical protein
LGVTATTSSTRAVPSLQVRSALLVVHDDREAHRFAR